MNTSTPYPQLIAGRVNIIITRVLINKQGGGAIIRCLRVSCHVKKQFQLTLECHPMPVYQQTSEPPSQALESI